MITTVLKRLTMLLDDETSEPGTRYRSELTFEDTPMTRQRLNELLEQTPSLPIEHLDV